MLCFALSILNQVLLYILVSEMFLWLDFFVVQPQQVTQFFYFINGSITSMELVTRSRRERSRATEAG